MNKAPNFTLEDQNGKEHSLNDYKGRWIIVYFYPKDNTPGCTKEACGFRDNMSTLTDLGIVVIGISKDSTLSHKKFIDKYDLNFTLLSDESAETIKAYNAWCPKKFMGREFLGVKRVSYLVDPDGNIAKKYLKVKPTEHAQQIINDVRSMSS